MLMCVLDFKENLEIVSKAISECDFMAIDGEFTGEYLARHVTVSQYGHA